MTKEVLLECSKVNYDYRVLYTDEHLQINSTIDVTPVDT